jgi:hypothetical protein
LKIFVQEKQQAPSCEERSDEAIHSFFARRDGLLRFARNDDVGTPGATNQPDGQITQNLSSPLYENIPLVAGQISGFSPPVSPDKSNCAGSRPAICRAQGWRWRAPAFGG